MRPKLIKMRTKSTSMSTKLVQISTKLVYISTMVKTIEYNWVRTSRNGYTWVQMSKWVIKYK